MKCIAKLVVFLLCFSASYYSSAQGFGNPAQAPVSVEVMPEFPGGIQRFYQYIGQSYKYPAAAVKARVSGRIHIQFVIEKDGSVTDVKVLKDLGYGTTEEAVRVIKRSPRWKPGIQKGKKVRVLYTLPLNLQLS
ncbi:energy transducer TonB [Paradesertivirga mongoliensis]|uniref:Energy transducer TonB n=1 Tax=Paradesertivirga mongoliensis TaxID=2100740 RepID=A0ABW4ZNM2_9SPHI|nr:energy transducer TonB [Pedobacter mongoliensis]